MDRVGVTWRPEVFGDPSRFLALIGSSAERISIPSVSNSERQGIIEHLTMVLDGHVVDNGAVEITSSAPSGNSARIQPRNLADGRTDTWFLSANVPNAWFCFDFKNKRVFATHYSLMNWEGEGGQLRSWKLEGSTDGGEWILLDERTDVNGLRGSSASAVFEIANPNTFRMVKLTQTGKSGDGDNKLCCAQFELFERVSETGKSP
jgi:hypothetical protein